MQMRIKEAHTVSAVNGIAGIVLHCREWRWRQFFNLGLLQLATHNFAVIGSFTEHGLIKVTNH